MIDQSMVRHLAKLGKLELTNAEVTQFAAQMDDIVRLMDTIQAVHMEEDTAAEQRAPLPYHRMSNEYPDDKTGPDAQADRDTLLEKAKGRQDGFYTVPKVVQES